MVVLAAPTVSWYGCSQRLQKRASGLASAPALTSCATAFVGPHRGQVSASRGNKSIEVPVANVTHMRDGKITEFWTSTTDPQASIDFWA